MDDSYALLRIFSLLRLILSGYLFFFWIPRKILPQGYAENRLDGVMFNIIHMSAIMTLLFPLFVYFRFFGFLFLIVFFVCVRLFFLTFRQKRALGPYLSQGYNNAILATLKAMEDSRSCYSSFREKFRRARIRLKDALTPLTLANIALALLIAGFALYIRLLGPFSSLVAAVSDMYQFFYWNQILKLNILFDKIAGAPYPWGGPVLVYTVNLFARLNTVVLYNSFPLLVVFFGFFSLYYVLTRLLDRNESATCAALVAVILFGIIIPSPLAENFFGTIFSTETPHVSRWSHLSFYTGGPGEHDQLFVTYPFLFFLRYTNILPYEAAAAFTLLFLFFLHKALITRRLLYVMLFAETLAVACAIHPGVLIPVFPASLLVTVLDLVYFKTDRKSFKRGVIALGAALALGNAWLVQFLIYGIPQDIGAAAPILDKLFHTDRAARDVVQSADTVVQIVSPSTLLHALFFFSLFFLLFALLRKDRQEKVSLAVIPLTALGTLFLYYAPNMGLPRFVDQSRMQSLLSFSYALAAGGFYYVFVERMCLRRILPVRFFPASLALAFVLALAATLLTPRWIDDPKYWRQARSMELKETPYFIYEIGDSFQPFSYTVVSNVEGFSQVYSHGYHMNPQEFLTTYAPLAKTLKIPTNYVFIFIENMPVPYQGGGQYWYRWRGDIMTKLKDWIALYGLHHRNLRLWKETRDVQVYLIDNRNAQDKKAQKLKQLRGEDR